MSSAGHFILERCFHAIIFSRAIVIIIFVKTGISCVISPCKTSSNFYVISGKEEALAKAVILVLYEPGIFEDPSGKYLQFWQLFHVLTKNNLSQSQ